MSIVVFWLHEYIEDDTMLPYLAADPCFKKFKDIELSAALAFAEQQRKAGHSHVTISSELSNHVGKAGVTSVEEGKTPDGEDYEWSKQHRGGPQLR